MRCDCLLESGKGEAVDNRRSPIGKRGKRRTVRLGRKLDDLYRAPMGAQALDNVTVVKISAGELIETAWDDENEFGHPSGAS